MIDFKDAKLELKMKQLGLNWHDFVEKETKGGGKGGQKINKSVNCVLLKHLPSGLEVRVQKFRELWGNRLSAYRLLVTKIDEARNGKRSVSGKKKEKIRKQKQRRQRKSKLKITALF